MGFFFPNFKIGDFIFSFFLLIYFSFLIMVQVSDVSDPTVKKLGVDALPAIVGWLSNGEKHILKAGINVKDLKSAVQDISILLDGFEKKNKKVGSSQPGKVETHSGENRILVLSGSNFDALCGDTSPVCIIGAFRSSRAREKLESILNVVSYFVFFFPLFFVMSENFILLTESGPYKPCKTQ